MSATASRPASLPRWQHRLRWKGASLEDDHRTGTCSSDVGPHPNPSKAAVGQRLHRLEPDPVAAPVVQRIFDEFLAGRGLFAIAEGLTGGGILSPSAHDPDRNRHRQGKRRRMVEGRGSSDPPKSALHRPGSVE